MTSSSNPTSHPGLTQGKLLFMAFAAGLSVANLYYNQPLLNEIRQTFHGSFSAAGMVPMLTQIGYAVGMLFLVPLGDMVERKKLILLFTVLAALCCTVLAVAPSLELVVGTSLFLGLSTMTPQLLVPFAAHLAAPEKRGRVIGTMVSGILLGILLARTLSGFVGSAFGWRAMFGLAALMLSALTLLLWWLLPSTATHARSYEGPYLGLLHSVWQIFRNQPILREVCLFGAMYFGAFSAFWVNLIFLLSKPYFHLGAQSAQVVGLYGLLGAIAALSGPLFGVWMDKADARKITGWMLLLTMFSFGVFALSSHSLWGLAVGVILMDIGVQCGHVANQSRIFKLLPQAQSRLQTAYMFFYFVGGATGSYLGSWAWSQFGWPGVCSVAVGLLGIALMHFCLMRPKRLIAMKTP
jgi:predicted MFS family arabinose efflux permease